jgi:Rrf2 family protein
MFRLSKKADYALLALQHLASGGSPGVAGIGGASARTIAARFNIPVELLAKILQRLAHLGLVAADRGVRGGYHLTRPPHAISVAEIVQAIDGPLTLTACSPGDTECDQFATCTVRDPLWKVRERLFAVLQATSLAEISETAATLTIRRPEADQAVRVQAP